VGVLIGNGNGTFQPAGAICHGFPRHGHSRLSQPRWQPGQAVGSTPTSPHEDVAKAMACGPQQLLRDQQRPKSMIVIHWGFGPVMRGLLPWWGLMLLCVAWGRDQVARARYSV
jgi:hypothetical protein